MGNGHLDNNRKFLFLIMTFAFISVLGPISVINVTATTHNEISSDYLGDDQEEKDPHGLYKLNTNSCATCHSTHRGESDKLLKQQSQEMACYLCHDGRGSKYDAKNGKYTNPDTSEVLDSVAGGFIGVDSSHEVETSKEAQGGAGVPIQMVCSSCHNPHGSTNHRDIQTTVNNKTEIVVEASVSISPFTNKEVVSYRSGITAFCLSCHADYVKDYQENVDNSPRIYRHPVEALLTGGLRVNDQPNLPKSLTFNSSLFTTLPTQGVPSGAYPNPNSKVFSTGGSLTSGTYYYLVTAGNELGESHQGYIKKMSVTEDNSRITLEWDEISNATSYYVYRAKRNTAEPTLSDFKLIANTLEQKNKFVFNNDKNTILFSDVFLSLGTKSPPAINSQGADSSKMVCITCHYAHGAPKNDISSKSNLKRKNNSGVCQDCHKK